MYGRGKFIVYKILRGQIYTVHQLLTTAALHRWQLSFSSLTVDHRKLHYWRCKAKLSNSY